MTSPAAPQEALQHLLATYQSASLASLGQNGWPLASQVAWALDEERRFLFFVSDLSEHTANLKACPRASLLLMEDEGRSPQVFARPRATFTGEVVAIPREGAAWTAAAQVYGARFGKLFDVLRGLPDFHMFALCPREVRLVIGFGAAYRVEGERWERMTLLTGS